MWERIPGIAHNEPLDCRNYAMAAFHVLDPDLDAVAARLRGQEVSKPAQPAPQKKRRGTTRNSAVTGGDW